MTNDMFTSRSSGAVNFELHAATVSTIPELLKTKRSEVIMSLVEQWLGHVTVTLKPFRQK